MMLPAGLEKWLDVVLILLPNLPFRCSSSPPWAASSRLPCEPRGDTPSSLRHTTTALSPVPFPDVTPGSRRCDPVLTDLCPRNLARSPLESISIYSVNLSGYIEL
ncbi:hypothetical protein DFH08DRAFT_358598 [Mycena albidolilacea]|uniref:Secreted protein n=1 Tax=Mycena albidolilacea TaxID=1033008 RepID=A0AAD7AJC8_9AGAR|nr:hypothetical protein DFH08DRAFT_358598 [Mycena albidolilacea]